MDILNNNLAELLVALLIGLGALYDRVKIGLKVRRTEEAVELLRIKDRIRSGTMIPRLPLADQARIDEAMDRLVEDGVTDRQLVLWAINGKEAPTHVSSLSARSTSGRREHYELTPIDDEYRSFLMQAVRIGHVDISTEADTDPHSLIGGLYRDEGIKHAVWAPIMYQWYEAHRIGGYLFMSHARYRDEPFSDTDVRRILAAMNMKSIIYQKAAAGIL
jgi:hypothetical protein